MNWYSAHLIFFYKKKSGNHDSYLLNENIYLINAENIEKAEDIANTIGTVNQDFNEDGHLELNEEKVMYLYAGTRKIISVETQPENDEFFASKSGVEVSYSEFEVDSIEQVFSLAKGEMVDILYRE